MVCVSGPEVEGLGVPGGHPKLPSSGGGAWVRAAVACMNLTQGFSRSLGALVPVQLVAQKGVRSQVIFDVFDSEI